MPPSDSRPPVGRGSGRPWPVAYPVPRATRRKKGLPGAWAVLFQRAVGSDPAGCASRLAHRVETAIAFRLHNALGTQNERYFVAVNPTAHSLACLRIGVFVTADAARLATGVGGSPFTGRVSHPLDGKQSFMTSPHRHSPLTSLAWSHRAPTPRDTLIHMTSATHRIRHGIRHTAALAGRRLRPYVANGLLRYMLIGYARVSKADGSQSLDLQRDALQAAGVDAGHVYHDCASGVRDDRPGLDSCLRALRPGDVLVVWKLDRLGRTLAHLVTTVQDLSTPRMWCVSSCNRGAK